MAFRDRVVIAGAGMGGLAAALALASRGLDVTVVERAPAPGGKMRESEVSGRRLDVGPTVLTMPWVLDELFHEAGSALAEHVTLHPAEILARHAWSDGSRLDLHADAARSTAAIEALAGREEAERFLAFCKRAARIYRVLERSFIAAARPSPLDLVRRVGLGGLGDLWRGAPFSTLWGALGTHFHDPRLRQLFGRYATYCGSSPFSAPAVLMLIAHVEREGVWLVEGGMHRVAAALANHAAARGARFRYSAEVAEILVRGGRPAGVVLATGERLEADAVVVNADATAVAEGRFGLAVASAVPAPRGPRSLSAVTWAMVAAVEGFPLARHTVFFGDDYAAEFDDLFRRGRLPARPTVYVCAQDRDDGGTSAATGAERLFCLVNAPASSDGALSAGEIERCEDETFRQLARCGLTLRPGAGSTRTTPADFERLFPATRGALYGRASHGWQASFRRPSGRTRMPGLYLAGGSVHPGPGVPMAALSGRLAASMLMADLASTIRSRRAAMPGGMSTPSATTAGTD